MRAPACYEGRAPATLPNRLPAAGWRSAPTKLHRHSTSSTHEASLSRQGTFGPTAGAAAAAAAADAALLAVANETAAALAGAGGQGSLTGSLQLPRAGGLSAFQQRVGLGGPSALERTSSSALVAGRLHRPLSSLSLASEDSVSGPACGKTADRALQPASRLGNSFTAAALPQPVPELQCVCGGWELARGGPGAHRASLPWLAAWQPLMFPPCPHALPALQVRPPLPSHRKVRFVHVKINRAHCRATYEGYPL